VALDDFIGEARATGNARAAAGIAERRIAFVSGPASDLDVHGSLLNYAVRIIGTSFFSWTTTMPSSARVVKHWRAEWQHVEPPDAGRDAGRDNAASLPAHRLGMAPTTHLRISGQMALAPIPWSGPAPFRETVWIEAVAPGTNDGNNARAWLAAPSRNKHARRGRRAIGAYHPDDVGLTKIQ
jgi:hypothetical protein